MSLAEPIAPSSPPARVPPPEPRHRSVRTDDGAHLAVTVRTPEGATGPLVLLVHGWAGTRAVWGPVAERLLARGLAVASFDLRGHGCSTTGSAPVTIARLAADLGTVRRSLRDGLVLVGHSGGGFVALRHLLDEAVPGASTAGLVLVGSAAVGHPPVGVEARLMGSELLTAVTARSRVGGRILRQTLGRQPSPSVVELVRATFAATPAPVRAAFFSASGGFDVRSELDRLTLPAAVVTGRDDRVVAPRHGRELALRLPDATFDLLDEVGHMPHLEAPNRVVNAIVAVARAGAASCRGRHSPR